MSEDNGIIPGAEVQLKNGSAVWVGVDGGSVCIRFLHPPSDDVVVGEFGPAHLSAEDGKQALRIRLSKPAAYALHLLISTAIEKDLVEEPQP